MFCGSRRIIYGPRLTIVTVKLDPVLDGHFHSFETFKQHARDGAVPTYSFVEPSFTIPMMSIRRRTTSRLSEQFIYESIRLSAQAKTGSKPAPRAGPGSLGSTRERAGFTSNNRLRA